MKNVFSYFNFLEIFTQDKLINSSEFLSKRVLPSLKSPPKESYVILAVIGKMMVSRWHINDIECESTDPESCPSANHFDLVLFKSTRLVLSREIHVLA